MKWSLCIALALVVSLCAATAGAEEYVFSLDKLAGKYTSKVQKTSKAFDFDAGMEFAAIESVELHIKGVLHPGALKVSPDGKKESVFKKGSNPIIEVFGEESSSDDVIVGHLRRRKGFDAVIELKHLGPDEAEAWQCLMDGELGLELALKLAKVAGKDAVTWQSRLAHLRANQVELVVRGVAAAPVPEPGMVGVGLLGVSMLALRRRRV